MEQDNQGVERTPSVVLGEFIGKCEEWSRSHLIEEERRQIRGYKQEITSGEGIASAREGARRMLDQEGLNSKLRESLSQALGYLSAWSAEEPMLKPEKL